MEMEFTDWLASGMEFLAFVSTELASYVYENQAPSFWAISKCSAVQHSRARWYITNLFSTWENTMSHNAIS